MLDLYLSSDGARAVAVVLLAIGQAVMSQWPDLRKWPETIATRSARQSTPVVPIDWAFAVWGLIFLGCFGFAIWQVVPAQLDDPLLRSIGWLAAGVFALNIAWEYYVPRREIDWGSVAIIVASLAVLLTIVSRIESAEPHDSLTFWLVAAPFQLFAGWISAATFVNLSSTLKLSGVAIGSSRSIALISAFPPPVETRPSMSGRSPRKGIAGRPLRIRMPLSTDPLDYLPRHRHLRRDVADVDVA